MTTFPSSRSYGRTVSAKLAALGILMLMMEAAVPLGSVAYAADTLGPNLIANPSFETSSDGLPTDWAKGGYGTNARTLTYLNDSSNTGSHAARVKISSYTSGDAKWYPKSISVSGGATYRFSDYSFADVKSEVDVELTHSNGSQSYLVLGEVPASNDYQQFTADFTVPNDVTSLTVFHLIDSVGTLTVDDYALTKVQDSGTNPPPSTDGLIKNGTFETAGTNGLPLAWQKGGYGNNTRSLTYPVPGESGDGAQVKISSYTSGDAKWFFDPISVAPGIYTYSDSYKSTVKSTLTVQYHKSDGSYSWSDMAVLDPSSSFKDATASLVVPDGTKDITVFHLIESVGTLAIDNASLVKAGTSTSTSTTTPPTPPSDSNIFSTGAVTLTFDDGWASQYQNAFPVMKQDGLVGTFYIVTHELADYNYAGFMSKANLKDLYAAGDEIGAHTQTHTDLTTLSQSQQKQEINGSKSDLLALNIGPINSFNYPYGSYTQALEGLVKDAGFKDARSTDGGYASPTSDKYALPRMSILNTTKAADIEKWIDTAMAQKSWLILAFHQVDSSGQTYATTPAIFKEVADYLAAKHVPVVTIDQGVQDMQ
ncbi:MAG TPA: polysaccharide deacetylase family protein [Candidatus Paceibacterota bacterium]